jgi:hypothetical protein
MIPSSSFCSFGVITCIGSGLPSTESSICSTGRKSGHGEGHVRALFEVRTVLEKVDELASSLVEQRTRHWRSSWVLYISFNRSRLLPIV